MPSLSGLRNHDNNCFGLIYSSRRCEGLRCRLGTLLLVLIAPPGVAGWTGGPSPSEVRIRVCPLAKNKNFSSLFVL